MRRIMKIQYILMSTFLFACGREDNQQNSGNTAAQTDNVWKFMTETGCKSSKEMVGKIVTPTTLEEWGCTKMQEQGLRKMYDCSKVPSLGKFFVMTQEKC